MSKNFIYKTYDDSEPLDLNKWFKENDWTQGNDFDTYEDDFINKVKQRTDDPILNIKERYTEIDGKKYGLFERYYNNQVTFNELVLNDPKVKSSIESYNNFDKNNQNSNYRSPNDLVHNEYTDSWDEPTWEQQLSIIEENVNNQVALDELKDHEYQSIIHYKDEVFDKYMNLLICRKNAPWIFGFDEMNINKLVKNFPMLIGNYDSEGLKTGNWFYHSFISDLIIEFSYVNPDHDIGYIDDTNGRILLHKYYKSNRIPFILDPLSLEDGCDYEYLSHHESDEMLFLENLIELDVKNRFNRNNVFNFLDNFKEQKREFNF